MTAAASRSEEHRRPLWMRLWYGFLQVFCRLLGASLLQIRWWGREHVPESGGVLVLCNHQSHLDPLLLGLTIDRRLNFLARETLFRFAPFRWLIRSLDAIPIDRDGLGLAGLKETLRRLKRGEMVLVFPEGTRTFDGEVAALKPGFSALASRGKCPMIPIAIEGAWHAWPRWRLFPRPATVHICIGEPLWPEELARFDERGLVDEMERRIKDCHAFARQQRRRALGRRDAQFDAGFPLPAPGRGVGRG